MMESSRMMKESDDMYDPTFIKVNILFYLFIFTKKKTILLIIF
jgi:hypothetical protein